MNSGKPRLLTEIGQRIAQKGRISFEEFMDAALYHPEYGYYTSQKTRIGKEGDYYTSSDVNKAFGACIMRQIDEMRQIIFRDAKSCVSPHLNLVEAGAGKGLLCADILASAKEKAPSLYEALRYVIVEKSPDFIEKQRRQMEEQGLLEKVLWASDIKEALEGGRSIVLSNELIDAFPVHKVKYSNGQWSEIYVTLKDGELIEVEDVLSDNRLDEYLNSSFPIPESEIKDGYTTEVNLRAIDWMREVGNSLSDGFVVTIDYGYSRKELYSPQRNRGTIMCYHRHKALEDPYMNIGEQDITAHVDFTLLAEAGRESGLEVAGFTEQAYFLMGCGIEEEFQAISEISQQSMGAFKNNASLKKLLMPGGMGSIFKVLIQHKGMERPRLRGFSFKDMKKSIG